MGHVHCNKVQHLFFFWIFPNLQNTQKNHSISYNLKPCSQNPVLAHQVHLGEHSVQHQHQIDRMQPGNHSSKVVDVNKYYCPWQRWTKAGAVDEHSTVFQKHWLNDTARRMTYATCLCGEMWGESADRQLQPGFTSPRSWKMVSVEETERSILSFWLLRKLVKTASTTSSGYILAVGN